MSDEIKSKSTCFSLLLLIEYIFLTGYKLKSEGIILIGLGDIVIFMCCFFPLPTIDNSINVIETVHNPFIFIEMTDIENNDECTICLSNESNNEWVKLGCHHIFHRTCISQWLSINNTCPICREEHINQ